MADPLTGELANLMVLLDDPANVIVAHLAKNNISPFADSVVLTDLVECDFPGYAGVPIVGTIPLVSDSERYGSAISQPVAFIADGLIAPQPASAVYVTIASHGQPPTLLMLDIFPLPITFKENGESFVYEVFFERFLTPDE